MNASLITGLGSPNPITGLSSGPFGIVVSGSDLFVTNPDVGTIGEYTTSGATVNASLITGFDGPFGIAVVPEPSTAALLAAGIVGLTVRRRRARGASLGSRASLRRPLQTAR